MNAVKRLEKATSGTEADKNREFDAFLDEFGTHYIQEVRELLD